MLQENENPIKPPSWLNQNFLENALKNSLKRGNIKLSDFVIQPAVKRGDNYLSQIFRASATVISEEKDTEKISFIIKSLPLGDAAEKFVEEAGIFATEIRAMTEIFPAIHQILHDAGANVKLCAEVFYHQGHPNDLIVVEDLQVSGFQMADRLKGLDLEHCILVVEALATLHAASLKLIKDNPSITDTHKAYFWSRKNAEKLSPWIISAVEELATVAEQWYDVSKDIPAMLRDAKHSIPEKFYLAGEIEDGDLETIIHGDPWTSNLLFQYKGSIPTAVNFVDFQMSTCCSPVIDLLYFIFTTPQTQVLEKHFEFLLLKYQERFVNICRKIQYPTNLTFDEVKHLFFKKIAHGFMASIIVFPIVKANSGEIVDFNDRIKDGNNFELDKGYFYTDEFRNGMKAMLPILLKSELFVQ